MLKHANSRVKKLDIEFQSHPFWKWWLGGYFGVPAQLIAPITRLPSHQEFQHLGKVSIPVLSFALAIYPHFRSNHLEPPFWMVQPFSFGPMIHGFCSCQDRSRSPSKVSRKVRWPSMGSPRFEDGNSTWIHHGHARSFQVVRSKWGCPSVSKMVYS